jgi:hypothetical protein
VSWDASFDGSAWNYTHNTNGMIAGAYSAVTGEPVPWPLDHPLARVIGPPWYHRLDGMTGREGSVYLGQIITGLEVDPARFRAMDPPNGWGGYDSVLEVLRAMKQASDGACCDVRRWTVSG